MKQFRCRMSVIKNWAKSWKLVRSIIHWEINYLVTHIFQLCIFISLIILRFIFFLTVNSQFKDFNLGLNCGGKKSTKPFSCQHILRKQASLLSCLLEHAGAEDRLLGDIPISVWIFHQECSHESSFEKSRTRTSVIRLGEKSIRSAISRVPEKRIKWCIFKFRESAGWLK